MNIDNELFTTIQEYVEFDRNKSFRYMIVDGTNKINEHTGSVQQLFTSLREYRFVGIFAGVLRFMRD